jgi:uncharacterized phage protein gp47/JayE
MTAPAEVPFTVFLRGNLRDEILAYFRVGLRSMTNPDTQTAFAETEIATATGQGSYFYSDADSVDLVLLTQQRRAQWFADQIRIDRASDEWLYNYHGTQWDLTPLAATGGTGTATANASVGATFVGSTTVPDPAATYGTDTAGLRYQVLSTVVTPGSGIATLTLIGIDTGTETNIASGTVITWSENAPLGSDGEATTTSQFTGGTNVETSAEFASRLLSRIRNKPASGNNSHFRSWARDSSNSVEDAFVYATAFHAGSVLVAITQKRAGVAGPNSRVASTSTISAVTAYITPPGSPVVPPRAYVLVTTVVPQPADAEMQISLSAGSSGGWADVTPWPGYTDGAGTASTVTVLTNQSNFRIYSDTALPTGVTAPQMMVWDEDTSTWEELDVSSVTLFGGSIYSVVLSSPPSFTIAVGDTISPYTARKELIEEAIESYFDSLGPGEVVDTATDLRAHRAARFPPPNEEYPQRAGSAMASRVQENLGVNAADVVVAALSPRTPVVPTEPSAGPALVTVGQVGIYAV